MQFSYAILATSVREVMKGATASRTTARCCPKNCALIASSNPLSPRGGGSLRYHRQSLHMQVLSLVMLRSLAPSNHI